MTTTSSMLGFFFLCKVSEQKTCFSASLILHDFCQIKISQYKVAFSFKEQVRKN